MKVKELIEALECMDPELPVYYSYNYGDYWHTTVAGKVDEVNQQDVVFSEYHRMMKIADDDRDDEEIEDGKKVTEAVVLG